MGVLSFIDAAKLRARHNRSLEKGQEGFWDGTAESRKEGWEGFPSLMVPVYFT